MAGQFPQHRANLSGALSGLLGMIGNGLAAGGSAATGANEEQLPDDSQPIGAEGDTIGMGDIQTPNSNSIRLGSSDRKTDNTVNTNHSPAITPQMLAQFGITKPGAFANILTGGRAMANYTGAITPLIGEQMRGQNALSQIGATGEQQRKGLATGGEQQRMTSLQNAAEEWMKAHDIPPTMDNFKLAQQTLMEPSLATAMKQKSAQSNEAGALQNATAGRPFQEATTAGTLAQAANPVAKFISQMPTLGIGQNVRAPIPGMGDYTASGAMPSGSTMRHSTAIDPKTGMPTTTESTQTSFQPAAGGLTPKLNLEDLGKIFDSSQSSGGGKSVSIPDDRSSNTSMAPTVNPYQLQIGSNALPTTPKLPSNLGYAPPGIANPLPQIPIKDWSADQMEQLRQMLGASQQYQYNQ